MLPYKQKSPFSCRGKMKFIGSIITLKELKESYFTDYMTMFSPKVRTLLHVSDQNTEYDYLVHCLKQHKKQIHFFFCIFDNKNNQLIGAINIRSPYDSRGQLESWLHETYWGGGRYQEALKLISDAYFERSGVNQITAHVDVDNMRSYKAHKKFGFLDTGMINGPHGKQYVLCYYRPKLSTQREKFRLIAK